MDKFLTTLYQIFAIKLLLAISILFLMLPFAPGFCSNIVAWLETDGSWSAWLMGSLFIILTTCRIISNLHLFSPAQITVNKGIFHTTIKEGVFTHVVERLWREYFQRTDLTVKTNLKKNMLCIKGEVPAGTLDLEELSSFLAKKLLSLTGFFGKITIESITKNALDRPIGR